MNDCVVEITIWIPFNGESAGADKEDSDVPEELSNSSPVAVLLGYFPRHHHRLFHPPYVAHRSGGADHCGDQVAGNLSGSGTDSSHGGCAHGDVRPVR